MATGLALSDVIAFILSNAHESELDALNHAIRERRDALRTIAAAAVKYGARVTIRDVSPKYLNGLTGVVKGIEDRGRGRVATVILDRESTRRLAFSSAKYAELTNQDSYELSGIPLSCCRAN